MDSLRLWRCTHSRRRWGRRSRRNCYRGRRCSRNRCCRRCRRGRSRRCKWNCGSFRRDDDYCRRTESGHRSRRNQFWRWRFGRNFWRSGCRRSFCLRFNRRSRDWRFGRNRWLCNRTCRRMFRCFFLLSNGAQHVSRTGNMRKVNFGFDLFFAVTGGPSGSGGARSGLTAGTQVFANQFRFVLFQRTRVRFLLGNTHRGQHVKNLSTLDFQLTGQIIDSNLHPLSFSFSGPAVTTLVTYARISNLTESLSLTARLANLALSVRTLGRTRRISSSALFVFRSFFGWWLFFFSRWLLCFFGRSSLFGHTSLGGCGVSV